MINIVYAITNVSKGIGITILSLDCKFTFEEGLISFVLAIILGFVLRMLPYEGSEWLRKSKFPYFAYYFSFKWNDFPKSFRDFYIKFANDNYEQNKIITDNFILANLNNETAKYLINNFKVRIYAKNAELRSEILFQEGSSRLAVGTLYALVFSLLLMGATAIISYIYCLDIRPLLIILVIYLVLTITIYRNLDKLRGKEVRTVLEAYAQL